MRDERLLKVIARELKEAYKEYFWTATPEDDANFEYGMARGMRNLAVEIVTKYCKMAPYEVVEFIGGITEEAMAEVRAEKAEEA